MSQKFTITEIYINNIGKKIKLTWDYFDRYPTEKEKSETRSMVDSKSKKKFESSN